LQEARATLARDIADGKRLQQKLKADRKIADHAVVEADQNALTANRAAVKRDREILRDLQQQAREGRGRNGRAGGARSGGGGQGRGGRAQGGQ
jgi:hypothetical protein